MNILGINSFFEHPAVALISDGKLVFAIEDERLTRIKHGRKYSPYQTYVPFQAIYSALNSQNMTFKDINEIAYSYDRWAHLRSIWGCFINRRRSSFRQEISAFRAASNVLPSIKSGFEIPHHTKQIMSPDDLSNVRYKEWNHHLSHAASTFFCSGFSESLIIVSDGSGENVTTSIYLGKDRYLKKVAASILPHSLGFFYSCITQHLGFEPFSDEYKVMGMAAYGKDLYRQQMQELVSVKPNGLYAINAKKLFSLAPLLGTEREYNNTLTQEHFDIARSAQVRLEEVLEHIMLHFMKKHQTVNLCLAGGTFLNILANARLVSNPIVKNYFIQPASHDAGTAIGAAALSWVQSGGCPQLAWESMFLGTEYSDSEIEESLKQASLPYKKLSLSESIQTLAKLLSDEKIIALHRGRLEFGPRALGNRSLLASPRSTKIRAKLNSLKVREQFRPLAPLITSDSFETYFEGLPNRYMMLTVKARDIAKTKIPAVVHHDGTARAQVIYKEHDSYLYDLLKAFEARSEVPVLINTSLNVRGKPIDESPYDSLSSFFTSGIDYLMMGSYLVKNPVHATKSHSLKKMSEYEI
jgi:carbamoyltransferase